METLRNDGFRKYSTESEIQVGDIVRLAADGDTPGYFSFSDSIVEKAINIAGHIVITLVRPHASVRTTTGEIGVTYLSTERYDCHADMLIQRYLVYTTGHSGNKDNRTF